MRQNYFFEYVPNAYINLCVDKAQQMANNRFVYDFKAGDKEAAGAYVEREIFLARTIHHDPISNRGILQEMAEGFYEAVAHSKRCFPQGVNINKKSNNNYNKVA